MIMMGDQTMTEVVGDQMRVAEVVRNRMKTMDKGMMLLMGNQVRMGVVTFW